MNWLIKVVQKHRIEKGYNFNDIEQATGIPAKRMFHFEKGIVQLTVDELEQLFRLLEIKSHDPYSANLGKRKLTKRMKFLSVGGALLGIIAFIIIFIFIQKEEAPDNLVQGDHLSSTSLPSEENPSFVDPDQGESEETAVVENTSLETHSTNRTFLRFWGNVQYQIDALPELPDRMNSEQPDLEIIPIVNMKSQKNLPRWLTEKESEKLLLNLGTYDLFAERTFQERDRLNKLGYKNIGLDYYSEAYKPIILDYQNTRFGFLSLTRKISDLSHEAAANRIGLPKAADEQFVLDVVDAAKEQVDFLIILIDWGNLWEKDQIPYHKLLAKKMVESGADLIVGNHPYQGQKMEWIEGTPVFYSLGHSVSPIQEDQLAFNYILDVELEEKQITALQINVGILKNGRLHFDLSDLEKSKITEELLYRFPDSDQLKIIYDQ